ncbi:hypothetical protein FHL01_13645 [Cylindrospermopsis raciborskii CS-506_C]|nr:hypothetical protein [Cylindrospermopsis raciborskii]MBA4446305.1 hypothetical protein [Cylindrospermopsis raciborskii CS-506_C]
MIFDRRPGLPPMGERISTEEVISPSELVRRRLLVLVGALLPLFVVRAIACS